MYYYTGEEKMTPLMLFAYSAGFFFLVYLVTSIKIISALEKRKVRINYWFIRFLMPRYAGQYKKIMMEETGEVPVLYKSWQTSLILMLISTFIAILVIVNSK
jgi:hypothetical protein